MRWWRRCARLVPSLVVGAALMSGAVSGPKAAAWTTAAVMRPVPAEATPAATVIGGTPDRWVTVGAAATASPGKAVRGAVAAGVVLAVLIAVGVWLWRRQAYRARTRAAGGKTGRGGGRRGRPRRPPPVIKRGALGRPLRRSRF